MRLLPDGRPMDLIIELGGQGTEQSDVLELLEEAWLEIGIKIYTKPLQRTVLRNRVFAGSTLMTMWFGLENGIPSAEMSPWEFAPTSQQQYQWPKSSTSPMTAISSTSATAALEIGEGLAAQTLSRVVCDRGIERIDLLKIDAEKGELEILRGIEGRDWAKIRQVVVDVHDLDNRLDTMTSLLRAHGLTEIVVVHPETIGHL